MEIKNEDIHLIQKKFSILQTKNENIFNKYHEYENIKKIIKDMKEFILEWKKKIQKFAKIIPKKEKILHEIKEFEDWLKKEEVKIISNIPHNFGEYQEIKEKWNELTQKYNHFIQLIKNKGNNKEKEENEFFTTEKKFLFFIIIGFSSIIGFIFYFNSHKLKSSNKSKKDKKDKKYKRKYK